MTESRVLFDSVIKNGYCIGCGACASKEESPFKMKMDEYGNIVAYADGDLDTNTEKVLATCPFSGKSKNENELGEEFFPFGGIDDNYIGKHLSCFAGYVKEGDFRAKGSSGGLGKWVGYKLLETDQIDHFIQLRPNKTGNPDAPLFEYAIFSDKDVVLSGSRSSYYPVTLDNIVKEIKSREGRYAITGVPCFIKTVRLLASENDVLKQRIKFTIGIVCGGMKSANQSKMIGWQLGVKPDDLIAIDFRRKYKDRPASQKIYQVWSKADSVERYKNANDIYGTDYGAGFFKPKACDYCDDVVGETADISVGDAWLPQFVKDPDGTSIIVVRNPDILKLLTDNEKTGELVLHSVTAEEVTRSQSGGFRHRRDALSMRLADRMKENVWVPEKRVKPNEYEIAPERIKIYRLREEIAKKSHPAFLKAMNGNNLAIFHKEMNSLVKQYRVANHGNYLKRFKKKVENRLNRMFLKPKKK